MENSFKLGRVAGIEIGIHYTWLFAFGLIAWSLAEGFFPAYYPGWGAVTYWLVGVVSALALFASVLVHELAHSFVALARGHGVHSITLFIFGGVSSLKAEAEDPKDEFLISVVGPLTSFALGAVCWLARQGVAPSNAPPAAILTYLAFINVMLGVFNLLPGFPLDGGRVLRSLVWAVTGSLRRATEVATYVGQGMGFLLIFWGVAQLLRGDFLGGLWIAFIGWFLNSAAETTRRQHLVQESLRGIQVAQLMNPHLPLVSPETSVEEFVFEHVLREGKRAVLVVHDGRLAGIVSITDAKKIPQDVWDTTTVAQIMTPVPLKTVSPDTDLNVALQLLVDGTLNQLPVVQGEQPVGLLSRADVLRFLQLREELGLRRIPPQQVRPAAV
jgi:Zn-dependent protease/predicted transcriptional regulator